MIFVSGSSLALGAYIAQPMDSANFLLEAPIEPIGLSSDICSILEIPVQNLPSDIFQVDKVVHGPLALHASQFLANIKAGTHSEDALHGRDDSLLKVICLLANLKTERITISVSTRGATRTDVFLAMAGLPPVVHVEEKGDDGLLSAAYHDLTSKFCPLPHYDRRLQFILGIAIAGDLVSFGKLMLVEGGNCWQVCKCYNLANGFAERARCVRAAVNVGRWALHSGKFVASVSIPIGSQISNTRRTLVLLSEGAVLKKYFNLDKNQFGWLVTLYTDYATGDQCKRIPYMEWATKCAINKAERSISLTLKPFGLVSTSRLPETLTELCSALRCVLKCIGELHAVGWTHLDLRWPNLVFMQRDEWVVIDAEYARPFGSPLPDLANLRSCGSKVATDAVDCYLVGRMMEERENLFHGCNEAKDLMKFLLAGGKALDAMKLPFFSQ